MKYTDFKAAMVAKKEEANKAAEAKPQVMAMAAPTEARQRIEAAIAEGRSKLLCNKNK